jgi:transcriptional regulator with XRE-family HTH domain
MSSELLDLVRTRRLELGLSYAGLAAVSVDPASGAKPSAAWLHRLETSEPVIPPSRGLLSALSVGLQLPLARLQEAAAAQFFGLQTSWERSGDASAVLADLAQLPEHQRRAFLKLIRAVAQGR